MRPLTRHDNGFDSIEWALKTHVKIIDAKIFHYAELFGNEDCPDYINFWYSPSPGYGDPPDYVWLWSGYDMSDDERWPDPSEEYPDPDEDLPF